MPKIQTFFEDQLQHLQAHPYYQKIMLLPQLKRWSVLSGLFLLSQILVFEQVLG